MLGPAILGIIRTLVPVLVGSALLWLTNISGVDMSGLSDEATVGLTAAVVTVYYAIVTFLERKVHPLFGVLLGYPKAPQNYEAETNGRYEKVD